jgi:hypothetical protein
LDVKYGLLQLIVDVIDRFEGVVLEYFLANFVSEIFLRVQLGCISWERERTA